MQTQLFFYSKKAVAALLLAVATVRGFCQANLPAAREIAAGPF
jgi:hypothetical protein